MAKVALPGDTALAALLSLPTSTVAAAAREGATVIGAVTVSQTVLARLADELENATGGREWKLEHLRDSRPLGEVLEISRLISAQRNAAAGRLSAVSRAVTATTQRPRLQPHAHVRGRGAPGLT